MLPGQEGHGLDSQLMEAPWTASAERHSRDLLETCNELTTINAWDTAVQNAIRHLNSERTAHDPRTCGQLEDESEEDPAPETTYDPDGMDESASEKRKEPPEEETREEYRLSTCELKPVFENPWIMCRQSKRARKESQYAGASSSSQAAMQTDEDWDTRSGSSENPWAALLDHGPEDAQTCRGTGNPICAPFARVSPSRLTTIVKALWTDT